MEAGLGRLEAQTLGQDVRELQKDARTGRIARAALITQPSVYLLCPEENNGLMKDLMT